MDLDKIYKVVEEKTGIKKYDYGFELFVEEIHLEFSYNSCTGKVVMQMYMLCDFSKIRMVYDIVFKELVSQFNGNIDIRLYLANIQNKIRFIETR